MVFGVVGSRKIGNFTVEDMKRHISKDCTQIISGGAEGIDLLARELALQYAVEYCEILPDYTLFGKMAPLVRNTKIVQSCDKVVAFWDYTSPGTAHAIRECIRLQVPVEIISLKPFISL